MKFRVVNECCLTHLNRTARLV